MPLYFCDRGISRACSHQLVRHRLASYSQQSQRYVSMEDGFGYIIPRQLPRTISQGAVRILYGRHSGILQSLITALNERGIEGEAAYEDARFVLPMRRNENYRDMNGRELLHFFTQRCCRRAQWRYAQWRSKCSNWRKNRSCHL